LRPHSFVEPVRVAWKLILPEQRTKLIGLLLARIFLNFIDVVAIFSTGWLASSLVSGGTVANDLDSRDGALSFLPDLEPIQISAIAVGLFTAKSLGQLLLLRMTLRYLAKIETNAAQEIMATIFSGDKFFYDSLSRGEILWAITFSSNRAFSAVLLAGMSIIAESSLFLLVFIAFAFVEPYLTIAVSIYFFVMIFFLQGIIGPRIRSTGENITRHSVKLTDMAQDTVTVANELIVADLQSRFIGVFKSARLGFALEQAKQKLLFALPRYVFEILLVVGVLSLLLWQQLGPTSIGLVEISIFLVGGLRISAAMLPIQNAISEIRASKPQARKAQEVYQRAQSMKQSAGYRPSSSSREPNSDPGPVSVSAVQLCVQYPGAREPVLKNVCFEIEPGEIIAVVGASGAGKSSLVETLLGLIQPHQGKVHLGGYSPESFRRDFPGRTSYVPQGAALFSGTIAENVALATNPNQVSVSRVTDALEKTGLASDVLSLPQGIWTEVGPKADLLSGGQIQRIALARALYSEPRLLVIDEGTSSLDITTEAQILATLRKVRGATTIFIIAHRMASLEIADRVIVVADGGVAALGTVEDVRKRVSFLDSWLL